MLQNLPTAAVVISALRVNKSPFVRQRSFCHRDKRSWERIRSACVSCKISKFGRCSMLLQLRSKYTFHKKHIWTIASGIGKFGLFINVRTSAVLLEYQNGSQFIINLSSLFTHTKPRSKKKWFMECHPILWIHLSRDM